MEEEPILSKLIKHGFMWAPCCASGHKASGWSVNAYLVAMFGTFKDSPACRAGFYAIIGNEIFPLKLCQVCWDDNVTVPQ